MKQKNSNDLKEQRVAMQKAKTLLQMPPYLLPRQKSQQILAKDELLNPLNFKNTKYMFIDISLNIPEHVKFADFSF
jgi:hypothetical protein